MRLDVPIGRRERLPDAVQIRLPSSVRATPGDDPCPGATVNQSAAATTTPATASKPIDRLLITTLYFPIPAGTRPAWTTRRVDPALEIELRAILKSRALNTCAAFSHAAP